MEQVTGSQRFLGVPGELGLDTHTTHDTRVIRSQHQYLPSNMGVHIVVVELVPSMIGLIVSLLQLQRADPVLNASQIMAVLRTYCCSSSPCFSRWIVFS
jgi:hypothetical protein